MSNGNGKPAGPIDVATLATRFGSFGLLAFIVYQLFTVEMPETRQIQRGFTESLNRLNDSVSQQLRQTAEQVRINEQLRAELQKARMKGEK